MEKEFVPYEIALVLKELGFDEPCFGGYDKETKKLWIGNIEGYEQFNRDFYILAPTYSQCFRWFRNKYNLNAPITDNGLGQYDFRINHNSLWSGRVWDTYEKAELECLKKLIEIAKNK